ncbi:16444_t:CDS:2, partial [Funneliformis caledonium]
MFTCSYNYCERTFSGCAALCEHTKSHKSHAYWKTLNSISNISYKILKLKNEDNFDINDDVYEESVDIYEDDDIREEKDNNIYKENNIRENDDNYIYEKDNICKKDDDIYEDDNMHEGDNNVYEEDNICEGDDDVCEEDNVMYDGSNIDNNDTDDVEDIETSEARNHNYNLCFPEQMEQITLIDTRTNLSQSLPSFPDTAYIEFMELVSIHHLSDSAGNDVLKWFNKHYLRKDIVLPKNTMEGRDFINSMNIEHLIYLKTKVLEYEDEKYYLHHRGIKGNFTLSNLNSFIDTYKISHHLALEAELAFDMLIDSLNEYLIVLKTLQMKMLKKLLLN